MPSLENLYIISGEDDFRKLSCLKEIISREAPEDVRDFDYERLEGKTLERGVLSGSANTPPLLSAKRVLHIDEAESLKSEVQKELTEIIDAAIERRADDISIVLFYSSDKKPPKDFTSRTKNNSVFGELKWKDACNWVVKYAEENHGIRIGQDVAKALVNSLGAASSGILSNEIDKLALIAKGGPITVSIVESVTGIHQGESVYDLCDFIGSKQVGKSLNALESVLNRPDFNGVRITISLSVHLANLGLARARLDAGEQYGAIKTSFGWTADKVLTQAQKWKLKELDYALSALANVDISLKTGGKDHPVLSGFIIDVINYRSDK